MSNVSVKLSFQSNLNFSEVWDETIRNAGANLAQCPKGHWASPQELTQGLNELLKVRPCISWFYD